MISVKWDLCNRNWKSLFHFKALSIKGTQITHNMTRARIKNKSSIYIHNCEACKMRSLHIHVKTKVLVGNTKYDWKIKQIECEKQEYEKQSAQ